jgi:peptidoglycan/xylan/chitin deacetylase (PgdA/CDA1 family)
VRRAQTTLPGSGGGVYILAYHLLDGGTGLAVDLTAAVFRRQLLELRKLADLASLGRAIATLKQGPTSGRSLVVVTFDDAYENFYTTAWPVIHELAVPVTLFVPVGFVEGRCSPPMVGTDNKRSATWGQLAEMAATGLLTIGSHGWSHTDLRSMSPVRTRDDLARSRAVLEDRLGQRVDTFCYPRGLWSRPAERQVANVYDFAAVGGGRRLTARNWNPLRLWRIPMRCDMQASPEALQRSVVWLEEWLADKARRYLALRRSDATAGSDRRQARNRDGVDG